MSKRASTQFISEKVDSLNFGDCKCLYMLNDFCYNVNCKKYRQDI